MDMWALGVCVYMWVFGALPFTGAAPFIIYDKIRSQVGPLWRLGGGAGGEGLGGGRGGVIVNDKACSQVGPVSVGVR
jgi:hypothetical protein